MTALASCPARSRPELFSAVGNLAETAGYMALDTGAHEDARRMLGFALNREEKLIRGLGEDTVMECVAEVQLKSTSMRDLPCIH